MGPGGPLLARPVLFCLVAFAGTLARFLLYCWPLVGTLVPRLVLFRRRANDTSGELVEVARVLPLGRLRYIHGRLLLACFVLV